LFFGWIEPKTATLEAGRRPKTKFFRISGFTALIKFSGWIEPENQLASQDGAQSTYGG